MTTARDHANRLLWRDTEAFAPSGQCAVDIQGWNSRHRYLSETIERTRPRIIVEMGVWKGASALWMASKLRDCLIDGVVIAVDTWLGSWDHWLQPRWAEELRFDRGYPRLFDQFATNVIASGLRDYIVPLPLDSSNAAAVVQFHFGTVDMIHLDGAHDYETVAFDLARWWPALRNGGTFIGDDYYTNGQWPGVKQATDEFLARTAHAGFEQEAGKWRAIKV